MGDGAQKRPGTRDFGWPICTLGPALGFEVAGLAEFCEGADPPRVLLPWVTGAPLRTLPGQSANLQNSQNNNFLRPSGVLAEPMSDPTGTFRGARTDSRNCELRLREALVLR